jgi:hypothetical protein
MFDILHYGYRIGKKAVRPMNSSSSGEICRAAECVKNIKKSYNIKKNKEKKKQKHVGGAFLWVVDPN